MLIDKINK